MADLSKLKRRNSLGAPPPMTEASVNLMAPETAPASAPAPAAGPQLDAARAPVPRKSAHPIAARTDGRSARRTGRTVQFATRVSAAFDERVRHIAEREGLLLVEVLERALDAYEAR